MPAPRRQQGVATIEFALLALLLIAMVAGVTEFGRAFHQYNTLLKATRAAAREFSMAGPVGTPGSRETQARCLAVYGKQPCGSGAEVALVEGLSGSMVQLSTSHDSFTVGGVVYSYAYACVAVEGFQFVSYVPWVIPGIAFAPISTCMRQSA